MGRVNVDAMLRSLTAAQFQEWLAYASVEPFDEVRGDLRAAQIVQMLLAVNMDQKKHKLPGLDELLLQFEDVPRKPKQTWQEQKFMAMMLAETSK